MSLARETGRVAEMPGRNFSHPPAALMKCSAVRALAIFVMCWFHAGARASEDPVAAWLASHTSNKVDLFCAGRVTGYMEINRAFAVDRSGTAEVVAFTFNQQWVPFEFPVRLSREELVYLAVLVKHADLVSRPRGTMTSNDSGNWELILRWGDRTNHVFWGPHEEERDPRMFDLEWFLQRLSYQAEVARRFSEGYSDLLINRCLYPRRLLPNDQAPVDNEEFRAQVRATPQWPQAKDRLRALSESMTPENWCGLVAEYLIDSDHDTRQRVVRELWKDDQVEWTDVPSRCSSRLKPVIALAVRQELESCKWAMPAKPNEAVRRSGAIRLAQETNQTSSAAGSRR